MSPELRWLSASRPRAAVAPRVSALLLFVAAMSACPFSVRAQQQAANETKSDLPAISVEQEIPKPKSQAVSKAKKSNAAAKQQQPATAGDGGDKQASATVTPGTRSGSLTVPNTAEARAEIDTTPGGVELVPDTAYKPSTPAATLKDALDYVPGVFVQPKWGDDSRLSIRGSGLSRNFHGRGVTLIMDGIIPISTADGASDFQEIDPTAYRYIEVYKGSNALRFGANSLGGAINFVMPTGYDADLLGARLDVGSFGFHKVAASSGGVSGAADYFITGTWQEQDGFRDHTEGHSTRGAMNVGYRLSPNLETRFYLNANHVRQEIPGAVTKSSALNNPQAAAPTNITLDYKRNLDTIRAANRTTLRVSPGTFLEVGGFYFNRHLDHPIFQVIDYRHDEAGGFARVVDEGRLGGYKNRFIAGVNVHHGDIDARRFQNLAGNPGALTFDAAQLSRNTVVYTENSFFVLPTVALVGGAQYVYASREQIAHFGSSSGEADYDFWSPKVGVLWDVTPSAQVFANISRSGETPTFSEVTISPIAITSLKVQEATTYEIGTRGSVPGFVWDLALYRSNLENEFQCLNTGVAGSCTQTNLDKTIHQGVELGFGAALWSGIVEKIGTRDELWLHAAYTLSDFRFDDDPVFHDNELPGAPRHYLRAELLYKHPSGVYFGPNVEWVPEAYYVDSKNTLSTEAYAIWGAKLGFDDGGPVTAYIEGRNLADEAYIASASVATVANYTTSALFEPGNGRAVYGGVQVKW